MAVLKTASNFQYFAPIASRVIRVDTARSRQSDVADLALAVRIPRPVYPLDPIQGLARGGDMMRATSPGAIESGAFDPRPSRAAAAFAPSGLLGARKRGRCGGGRLLRLGRGWRALRHGPSPEPAARPDAAARRS